MVKKYTVQQPGCLIWHETISNRCRAPYQCMGAGKSHSCKTDDYDNVTGAINYCLLWMWSDIAHARELNAHGRFDRQLW